MRNNKSAKDIAFDKERAKFRKEIRELSASLNDKEKQIGELKDVVREKEEVITKQKEWIERLLEYTELTEDEMRKLIKKEKYTAEIIKEFASMQRAFSRFGFFG